MKILLCSQRDPRKPGGASTYLRRLGQELNGRGHCISMLCEGSCDEDVLIEGVPAVIHKPPSPFPFLWRFPAIGMGRRYREIIRPEEEHYDAVISHSLPYLAALGSHSVRTVYLYGGTQSYSEAVSCGGSRILGMLRRVLLYRKERRVIAEADIVVVPSDRNRRRVQSTFNVDEGNIKVSPQGVRDIEVSVTKTKRMVRNSMDTPEGAVVFMCIGEMNRNKNFGAVIKALQYTEANSVLWIVGDGEELNRLRSAAKECNVSGRCRFTGYIEEPSNHYHAADVVVVSSISDTFPHVYLEALVSGCIIIGPKHAEGTGFSAYDEVAPAGMCGFAYAPYRTMSLACRMREAGAIKDWRYWQAMARSRGLEFSWKRHASDILECLEAVVGGNRGID